jgi:hypothetical protein
MFYYDPDTTSHKDFVFCDIHLDKCISHSQQVKNNFLLVFSLSYIAENTSLLYFTEVCEDNSVLF